MRVCVLFLGGVMLVVGLITGRVFAAEGDERFSGGSYDGYDTASVTNITLIASAPITGTFILIH